LNHAIIGFLILILISFFVGSSAPQSAFKATLIHVVFVLVALVVTSVNLSESFLKRILTAIFAIAFIQIPASIIQYYVIYSDLVVGARQDNSGGLLGPSSGGVNAVFMTFIFSILLGFIMTHGWRFRYMMMAGGLLIPIILGSARAGMVFFVVTGVLTLIVVLKKDRKKVIKTIAYGTFMIACTIAMILFMARKDQLRFITDPTAMYEYSSRQGKSLGRLNTPGYVHNIIGGNVRTAIFGLGPGAITHTSFTGRNQSDFYNENLELLRVPTSYAYITLELGYGGLLLFLYLHWKVLSYNLLFLKKIDDVYWKGISIGLVGIIFTSIYTILYTNTWVQSSLMFTLWFIAGSIYRVGCLRGIFRNQRIVVPRYSPSHRIAGVVSYR
jgi:hypothetical protein